MTSPEVINCLKGHDLFAGIKEEILNAFVTKAVVKSFSKGKILYIENDQAEFFYFIKKGWIKLFNETLDGTEAIIDILTCNHVFGETAIFDNGLYTSSAEVVEDTVLVLIPTSVLKENLERDKTFIANMFAAMSKHRKCQEREIEHLTIQNAPQRVGCFILRLCPKEKAKNIILQLPYDKLLLASRLGMKPETFSRALNKLRDETGIRISGARIEIDNINQLSNFSCSACSSSYPCEDI